MKLSYAIWQNYVEILESFFAPLVIDNLRVNRILEYIDKCVVDISLLSIIHSFKN